MKMREFFSGPEKWTKGVFGRAQGKEVLLDNLNTKAISPDACCLYGAICYCYGKYSHIIGDKIEEVLGTDSLVQWNDAPERTFEEVKALVEKLDI